MLKPSTLLLLAGGLLAAVAFFLPFLVGPGADRPGPGLSLEQVLLQSGLWHVPIIQGEFVDFATSAVLQGLTVAAPVLLLVGGWLAPKIGRAAFVWSLSSAVAVLSYLLVRTEFLGMLVGAFEGLSLGESFQQLLIGFWLTALGYVLGVIGALLGWREQSRLGAAAAEAQGAPVAGQGLRIRPGMILVLCGGLAAVGGFFIAPYLNVPSGYAFTQESLFDLIKRSDVYLELVWPEVVMAVVLLACGLLALRGGQGAYLGSLSGALIGLPFLLGADGLFILGHIGTGDWLALIGCSLGIIGALVGLRKRQVTPVAVGSVETLAQR